MELVHAHQEEGEGEGLQAALQVQEVVGVLSHHLQVGVVEVELLVDLEEVEEELLDVDLAEVVEVEHLYVHLEEVEDLDDHLEGAEGLD
jgi:hypothetical protein